MLPAFNHSHVLPPFLGDTMSLGRASPYVTDAAELATQLGMTAERKRLLHGFFALRECLDALGFSDGFFWLDGSFVELVEESRGTAPADIDVVCFVHAPIGIAPPQVQALMDQHPELFHRETCKIRFGCDFFIVNLDKPAKKLVQEVRYWYGLFSHRQSDQLWKGMLEVPLAGDYTAAAALLDNPALGDHDVAPA